ncbi:MAG: hypothetical protein M3P41_11310, partial [Actinomycetota bacterium]|nr:hypothetical protein [Actinomycetota bacterium]
VDAARFDLCGLSWGALVALRFALEEPARVRRLAVCAGFASLPRALRALQYALSLAGRELARPMREGARFDVRSQIASLEPPLLVLCGERDRVNRPLLARARDARAASELRADPRRGPCRQRRQPGPVHGRARALLR